MRQIARSAGTSLANLYNYYVSKEALFAEVTLPARRKMMEMASVLSCADEEGFYERLKECRTLMDENQEMFRLLLDGPEACQQDGFRRDFIAELTALLQSRHGGRAVPGAFFRLYAETVMLLLAELLHPGLSATEKDSLLDACFRFVQSGWKGLG